MKIVGYQIIVRITRFVTLVIRPDYQKFCLRSTPDIVPNSGGDLWWFAMMCSGLRWFAVVCLLVIPLEWPQTGQRQLREEFDSRLGHIGL